MFSSLLETAKRTAVLASTTAQEAADHRQTVQALKCAHTAVLLWGVHGFRVLVAVGQTGADQLLEDSLCYGHHHGGGGCVAEPHGQEYGAAHEAQHQPEGGRTAQKTLAAVEHSGQQSVCDAHMPGFAPAIITMRRAMRLCRFHFSMEAARQMTPISSRVVSLQYSAAT